jgi:hypothetical protein
MWRFLEWEGLLTQMKRHARKSRMGALTRPAGRLLIGRRKLYRPRDRREIPSSRARRLTAPAPTAKSDAEREALRKAIDQFTEQARRSVGAD